MHSMPTEEPDSGSTVRGPLLILTLLLTVGKARGGPHSHEAQEAGTDGTISGRDGYRGREGGKATIGSNGHRTGKPIRRGGGGCTRGGVADTEDKA